MDRRPFLRTRQVEADKVLPLLLAAGTFAFPGGGAPDLAGALSHELAYPVAILIGDASEFNKFAFEWNDRSEFWRKLRALTKLEKARDSLFALYPDAWPTGILVREFLPEYMISSKATYLPTDIGFGRVFSLPLSPGDVYSVKAITMLRLEKSIVAHWTYHYCTVAIVGREIKPDELAMLVAGCVGGRYSETDEEYRIDFDPESFRKRAVARYKLMSQDPRYGFRQVDFEYAAAVMSQLSKSEIEALYIQDNNVIEVEIPTHSAAHELVHKRLEERFGAFSGKQVEQSTAQAWARIRDGADFTKPFRARLHTDGRILTVIRAKDPRGSYVF